MRKLKIIFSSVAILSLFSCKKVIDVKETDFIGGDIALKTVGNNEAGVIGAYAAMNPEMSILFNGVMSDELKVSEFYNAATVHEWQFTPTDITIRDQFTATSAWYTVIDRANRVLRALPNADSTRAEDTRTLRNGLKGEALFIRAYSQFELFRFYSGNYDPNGLAMPYMTSPSPTPSTQYARIKMGPYFDSLNADLAAAKTLVADSLTNPGRANKMAVAGLQARVALYMRDWQKAITYSTEYINALPLATRAQFPGIWTDAVNTEVAFKIKKSASTGRVGSLFRGTSATTTSLGTVTWQPSDKIWNSYDQVNDVRFPSYFKDEPLLSTKQRPSHLVAKYAGSGYGTTNENVNDVKMFRTAEMYLIRAEAKAETGDLAGAAADVNTLRINRIANYVPVVYASKDEAITDILQARFKELAYEGHRFWDLKRRNLPVQRLASDAPNTNSVTLPAGNFRFLLPIPSVEIQANPLMVQNPGYQ